MKNFYTWHLMDRDTGHSWVSLKDYATPIAAKRGAMNFVDEEYRGAGADNHVIKIYVWIGCVRHLWGAFSVSRKDTESIIPPFVEKDMDIVLDGMTNEQVGRFIEVIDSIKGDAIRKRDYTSESNE